jgi:hypothetical protein
MNISLLTHSVMEANYSLPLGTAFSTGTATHSMRYSEYVNQKPAAILRLCARKSFDFE